MMKTTTTATTATRLRRRRNVKCFLDSPLSRVSWWNVRYTQSDFSQHWICVPIYVYIYIYISVGVLRYKSENYILYVYICGFAIMWWERDDSVIERDGVQHGVNSTSATKRMASGALTADDVSSSSGLSTEQRATRRRRHDSIRERWTIFECAVIRELSICGKVWGVGVGMM